MSFTRQYFTASDGGGSSDDNFQGFLDASGSATQLDDAQAGQFWNVSVAGTLLGKELQEGEFVSCVQNVTGTPTDFTAFRDSRNDITDNLNGTTATKSLSENQGRVLNEKILALPAVPTVIDNVASNSATDALSANQGRILQGEIDNLPTPPVVEDNLTSTSTVNALSANQGRALKSDIDALPTPPSVVDNLTSTSTTSALSANQGRELKTLVDAADSPNRFIDVIKNGHTFTVGMPMAVTDEQDIYEAADSRTNANFIGFIVAITLNGFTIQEGGDCQVLSGLIAGQDYYLSINGTISTQLPTLGTERVVKVLRSTSTTGGFIQSHVFTPPIKNTLNKPTGIVLQHKEVIQTAQVVITPSNLVDTDWPGMSIDITQNADVANNSKFKVSINASFSPNATQTFWYLKLFRVVGGVETQIALGDAFTVYVRSWVAICENSGNSRMIHPFSATFIDDPDTSAQVTYKLKVIKGFGSTSISLNRAMTTETTNTALGSSVSIFKVEELMQ